MRNVEYRVILCEDDVFCSGRIWNSGNGIYS